MIQVGVSQDDFFHASLHLLNRRQNAFHITAGIHNGRLACSLTFDNGTILLVGCDWNDGTLNSHKRCWDSL